MASSQDYVNYVVEQLEGVGIVTYKKMFGEYCVYINEKPIIWVCDDTVFVKKLNIVKELLERPETGFPYPGAKEHYVLDVDDAEEMKQVVMALEKITPVKVKKNKR
jgi:TfoX/Sxy family transcriptional regulator of competence genes